MRTLITGGSGFVGRRMAAALAERGSAVVSIARGADTAPLPGVRYLAADILDAEQLKRVVEEARPEAVVHLAGVSSVRLAWEEPALAMQVNCVGTLNLLEAIRATGQSPLILNVGSAEEYGLSAADTPAVTETAALRPVNPYGVSKAAQGQLALQLARRHGLRVIHVRPFAHTGPGQKPGSVMADWARQIAALEKDSSAPPVLRVGNLSVRRDLLHVDDVVGAYLLLLARGTPGEAYNVASRQACSLEEVLGEFIRLARFPLRPEADPALLRPADVPLMQGDASKLQALGWKPAYDLSRIVSEVLEDWRRRP